MDEWDKVYSRWKSIEDEKSEKIKNKKEEKRKAEVILPPMLFILMIVGLFHFLKYIIDGRSEL